MFAHFGECYLQASVGQRAVQLQHVVEAGEEGLQEAVAQ